MAALSQLVPLSELDPNGAASIRNAAIKQVLAEAAKALNYPEDRLVVRDIRPDIDLDYGTEDWGEKTGATAGAYETMSTGTNVDQRWMCFYGVQVHADHLSCSMLKFNIGGSDRAIWALQPLKLEDGFAGYSPAVMVIPPNAPYTISRYVVYANSGAPIVLKGFCVEPRGKVVSP